MDVGRLVRRSLLGARRSLVGFSRWLTRSPDDPTDRTLNALKRLGAVIAVAAPLLAGSAFIFANLFGGGDPPKFTHWDVVAEGDCYRATWAVSGAETVRITASGRTEKVSSTGSDRFCGSDVLPISAEAVNAAGTATSPPIPIPPTSTSSTSSSTTTSTAPLLVPDLSNVRDRASSLESLNLKLIEERTHSDSITEGAMISQDPKTGTEVVAGSTVTVTISLGPEPLEIPSLVDLSENEASFRADMDFDVRIIMEESTTHQPGLVFRQSPMAGEFHPRDSVLTLYVALGPFCDGIRATVLVWNDGDPGGTGDADVIAVVGDERVEIRAGDGDDRICLGSGGGRVFGERGQDRIFGGDGDDLIWGGDGDDFIDGGGGDDILSGEDQSVSTARGDDEIRGGPGDDILNGSRGNDHLSGGLGADALLGGDGDDTLDDLDWDPQATGHYMNGGDGEDTCPGLGNVYGPASECESW